MSLPPRRSSSLLSLSSNVAPADLFHDEEISFTGVHVNNPLWDNGDISSSHDDDEDDLLLHHRPRLFDMARELMMAGPQTARYSKLSQPKPKPKTRKELCRDICCGLLVGIVVLAIIGGMVILSLNQTTAVWASSGLMGDDDNVLLNLEDVEEAMDPALCPTLPSNHNAFEDFLEAIQLANDNNINNNNNTTDPFCDETLVDGCTCDSTVRPTMPQEDLSGDWQSTEQDDLDVVLLGDALIENCARGLSYQDNGERNGMAAVCHQVFRKESGGSINGLALGASGDRAGHLLYRLQQDPSILESLNPKVWWIQIGNNDLEGDSCSSESVAAAIMPLIYEIQRQKPLAKIVLNSIIPTSLSLDTEQDEMAWRRLFQTNEYLSCFAQDSEDFEFFNTYDFLEDDVLLGSMSLTGMQSWGEAIAERVLQIVHL